MKKIVTLILSVVLGTCLFAQPGHAFDNKEKDMAFIKAPYNTSYTLSQQSDIGKDQLIKQINHDFNVQAHAIQRNRHLRPFEKERQLQILQAQKERKIQEVNDRFDRHHYHVN